MNKTKKVTFGTFTLFLAIAAGFMSYGCQAFSAEQAYEMTPVDKVEIKLLPPSKILVTTGEGEYFMKADNLFMRLFGYIKDNDVSMTVPVEARMEKASMVFYIGSKDIKKKLKDNDIVKVVSTPSREVVSLGFRGSYTEKNFVKVVKKLKSWLTSQDRYESTGIPYAVFWNGPFIPGFLKRFEVHIPVKKVKVLESDKSEGAEMVDAPLEIDGLKSKRPKDECLLPVKKSEQDV